MSYILDALKKSEQQRNSMNLPIETPTLTHQPAPATSRFVLPLTLLAIALAAGWFFVRFQQPVTHPLTTAKMPVNAAIQQETQTPTDQSQNPGKAMPSSKTEPLLQKHQQATTATANLTGRQAPFTRNMSADTVPIFKPISPTSPVSRANSQPPELAEEIAHPSPAETNIPSLSELPVSVQQSLPTINIEGHIYDQNPAARMVIINGAIRREKQHIDHGMILEEITPNGVILSHQGHTFHIGVFEQGQ